MARRVLKYEAGRYYAGKVVRADIDLSVFVAIKEDVFTGDGVAYQFALTDTPYQTTVEVYVNGLRESHSEWSLKGKTLTLSYAPQTGDVVVIRYFSCDN